MTRREDADAQKLLERSVDLLAPNKALVNQFGAIVENAVNFSYNSLANICQSKGNHERAKQLREAHRQIVSAKRRRAKKELICLLSKGRVPIETNLV